MNRQQGKREMENVRAIVPEIAAGGSGVKLTASQAIEIITKVIDTMIANIDTIDPVVVADIMTVRMIGITGVIGIDVEKVAAGLGAGDCCLQVHNWIRLLNFVVILETLSRCSLVMRTIRSLQSRS